MLPVNLVMLDRLIVEVRRLSMVQPPGRVELRDVLEQVETLRAAARIGGNAGFAAHLSAVASCVRAAMHDPLRARDPLLESWVHLMDISRSHATEE